MTNRNDRAARTTRIELIDGDPRAFASTTGPPPAGQPEPGRRPGVIVGAVIAAVVVAVIVSVVWPRHSSSSVASTSTSSPSSITEPTPTSVAGRPAELTTPGAPFLVVVDPTHVGFGDTVTIRLQGDLRGVSSLIPAVAWLDQRIAGGWRTVYWVGGSATGSLTMTARVSEVGSATFGDGPFLAANQPVLMTFDSIDSGTYRLCRSVPLRTVGSGIHADRIAWYVCTSMVVDHIAGSDNAPTAGTS